MRAGWPVVALVGVLAGCQRDEAARTQVRSSAVDERREAYFAGPWPDDRRLVDGGVAIRRFPKPGVGAFQQNLLDTGEQVLRGWGLAAPIYVPFTGALDLGSLPATVEASTSRGASVFLTALDPASPDFARRHPVDFHFFPTPTLYLPANVLAVRPFPGSPLEPSTTYALVVTRGVRDEGGAAVGAEQGFRERLRALTATDPLARLPAALDALGVGVDEVAGGFSFTTQPVLDEALSLRDWLEAQPTPHLEGAHQVDGGASFSVVEGTYQAPLLQHGAVPFAVKGGDFEYDDAGAPVPAAVEAMRVALCVPPGPVPPGGFPVVLYSHGTGGDFESVLGDVCADLASVGIAAAGIDQVFHGPRGGSNGGCFGQPVELCFFNPVNVVAGRNNIRQAALDNIFLRKLLASVELPATLDAQGRTVRFAADAVGFFGHSQGGLSGAVYAALDPHLKAAVLSGAGGHLTTTVLVRTTPFSVKSLAEGELVLGIAGRESLDAYHPALALIQTLAEVADPASYGRFLIARPQGAPKHLYLTNGLLDPYTSFFTAEVLAATAGVPQAMPVGDVSMPAQVAGVAPVAWPVEGDVHSSAGVAATAVFRQFPGQGHFPVFLDATARAQWLHFFDTALHGRPVVVPAP